jgi:hypothetical protein
MNTYTFKCLHCGKEDEMDKNYLFEEFLAADFPMDWQSCRVEQV